jgi:hypothetical protein
MTNGVPPYTFTWDIDGYVRHDTINQVDDYGDIIGVQVNIVYLSNASWTLTIMDDNNCSGVVSSSEDEFENLLSIVNYAITNDDGTNSGTINISVEGGDGTETYNYIWSGPNGFSLNNAGAGYAQNLTNLASGWYTVSVTTPDGQTATAWYWVSRTTRGRGKVANMPNMNVLPNPFSTSTNINFTLPTDALTTINLFNVKGQLVRKLFNKKVMANTTNTLTFEADQLQEGLYLLQLTTDTGLVEYHKLLLSK